MATSVLEQLRAVQEDVELYEKGAARVIADREINPKMRVQYDHCVKASLKKMQDSAKIAVELYGDADGLRKEEIAFLAGTKTDGSNDVWANFYDRVKGIKEHHRKFHDLHQVPEQRTVDSVVDILYETEGSDQIFSGEEDLGTCVDLAGHHLEYINLKKLKDFKIKEWKRELIGRLDKKLSSLKAKVGPEYGKLPEAVQIKEAMNNIRDYDFPETDYITYLTTFDRFHLINRFCKYADAPYEHYIETLLEYLKIFFERQNPLANHAKVHRQFEDDFQKRWDNGDVHEWVAPTHKEPLYCLPTDKLFANETTMKSHKQGKVYQKAVKKLQQMSGEKTTALIKKSEA
eukprot:Platyproteum_vivax@DN6476_c0_g1_i1.p1